MSQARRPIARRKTISMWNLLKSPIPRDPRFALVLADTSGRLVGVVHPGQQLPGLVTLSKYADIYEVDISHRSFSFECLLPTADAAFNFSARVQVSYSVADPVGVVRRNITDGQQVLEPFLIRQMKQVSSYYELTDLAAVETKIAHMFYPQAQRLPAWMRCLKLGLVFVSLSLDADSRELLQHAHRLQQTRRDIEFYGSLIEGGLSRVLALQLAQAPEDIPKVLETITQERRADMENQLQALRLLMQEDFLEDYQSEEASERIVRSLTSNFGEFGPKKLQTSEQPDVDRIDSQLSSPTTLRVSVPLPPLPTLTQYFDSIVGTLNSLDFLYSVFAILSTGDLEEVRRMLVAIEESSSMYGDLSLRQFLSSDRIDVKPLRVVSIRYGSPASFDLLGIGAVLEITRDTIKDLAWRGKHERLMAQAERERVQVETEKTKAGIAVQQTELEKARLENQKLALEIAQQKLELILKTRDLRLSDKEKADIVSTLAPKMKVIAGYSVAPLSPDDSPSLPSEEVLPGDSFDNDGGY